jgi:hypothetical protein
MHPISLDDMIVGALAVFREQREMNQEQIELRNAYQLAERRTAELDAVIESMPHGVFIVTHDGKVRSNQRTRSMTGNVFPVQLGTLRSALAGESSAETVQTSGGWIHSVAAPIFLNDRILGGVAVNTDVTQQLVQEEALRRTEKLAAVGQLAASIAHEINNPLESITNLLYLIRQSVDKYGGRIRVRSWRGDCRHRTVSTVWLSANWSTSVVPLRLIHRSGKRNRDQGAAAFVYPMADDIRRKHHDKLALGGRTQQIRAALKSGEIAQSRNPCHGGCLVPSQIADQGCRAAILYRDVRGELRAIEDGNIVDARALEG